MNDPDFNAPAIADYIADLSKELAAMARSARMDLLSYLLEMASDEAKARSRDKSETVKTQKPDQKN